MKGFVVDLEEYCTRCPEFEVEVEADVLYTNDFVMMDEVRYYSRRITCSHIERCRSIYKKAKKDIKDDEYRRQKEIKNERGRETQDNL